MYEGGTRFRGMTLSGRTPWLLGAVITVAVLITAYLSIRQHFQEKKKQNEDADAAVQLEAAKAVAEKYRQKILNVGGTEIERKASEDLSLGVLYLLNKQSPDGSWRSDRYASFKDGSALTPLAVEALQEAGENGSETAIRTGCEFLAKMVKVDGTIANGDGKLPYPVYTASLAVSVLSRAMDGDPRAKAHFIAARDAWLRYLLDRQLTEKLGWKPDDNAYGGWGYCALVPKKPEPGKVAPPLVESNLSATVFALEALNAAGVKDAAPFQAAAVFVLRCQNPDGGFHFIYNDPVRNKAGESGGRFPSYGSATADGLRCLKICHLRPQARQAASWLEKNFRADVHPGDYTATQKSNRNAVYFYYLASAAKAFRAASVTQAGGGSWKDAIAKELDKRQSPNGGWFNTLGLVREDEPLVATACAVIALANGRPDEALP